jgi:hypothetical protein
MGAAGLGSAIASGSTYPIVTEPPVEHMPPVTTPSGAVVQFPANPKTFVVSASRSCERELATFHDGSAPAKRLIVIPPRPGLSAEAVSPRTVQLHWSFHTIPVDCRPAGLMLGIVANGDARATPVTITIRFSGVRGSTRMSYPSFVNRPNVALASAVMQDGRRSRTARVLIRR